jgi:predicted transcriptional regulator
VVYLPRSIKGIWTAGTHRDTTSLGGGALTSKYQKSKKTKAKTDAENGKIEFELNLLQRHIALLKAIIENEPIGIIRLSEMLNYPQHKVRYSLRILEQERLIEPSLEGAMTTDELNDFLARLSDILDGIVKSVKEIEKSIK